MDSCEERDSPHLAPPAATVTYSGPEALVRAPRQPARVCTHPPGAASPVLFRALAAAPGLKRGGCWAAQHAGTRLALFAVANFSEALLPDLLVTRTIDPQRSSRPAPCALRPAPCDAAPRKRQRPLLFLRVAALPLNRATALP